MLAAAADAAASIACSVCVWVALTKPLTKPQALTKPLPTPQALTKPLLAAAAACRALCVGGWHKKTLFFWCYKLFFCAINFCGINQFIQGTIPRICA